MDDDHPADIGRPRRQGDRITPLFCCGCLRPVMALSGRPGQVRRMSAIRGNVLQNSLRCCERAIIESN